MRSLINACLITYLTLLICACSASPLINLKDQRIRLAKVWQSSQWLTTGAIDRRGPLVIWLAKSTELRALKLANRAWLQPHVAVDLNIKTRMNLTGHRQSSVVSIELDGLRDAFKLQLTLPNTEEQKALPKNVDLILPVEQLVTSAKVQSLSIHEDGFLGFTKPKKTIDPTGHVASITKLNASTEPDSNETHPYVYRFDDVFNVDQAFPGRIIAERIDLKDRVEVHWFPPLIKQPKDLWIATSPALDSDQNLKNIVVVHLRQPKALTLIGSDQYRKKSYYNKTYKLGELSSQSQCDIKSPCPIFIRDIYRLNRKCLHDLCLVKTVPNTRSK